MRLVLDAQPGDQHVQHGTGVVVPDGDKGLVVEEGKHAHDELAVHAVRHAAVTGDRVAKVLELESSLETRGKETAEWGNQRCKSGPDQGVKVHGRHRDAHGMAGRQEKELGGRIGARDEDGVGVAVNVLQNARGKVCCRANEIVGAEQAPGETEADDHGRKPSANETFDRLLGREFDELSAAKGDAANVGKDIIGDDKGGG